MLVSLTSKLWNIALRALSNRECGALEAADTLLGFPLYGTERLTVIKWLDVIRVEQLKKLFALLVLLFLLFLALLLFLFYSLLRLNFCMIFLGFGAKTQGNHTKTLYFSSIPTSPQSKMIVSSSSSGCASSPSRKLSDIATASAEVYDVSLYVSVSYSFYKSRSS